jgi:hypothetical protein
MLTEAHDPLARSNGFSLYLGSEQRLQGNQARLFDFGGEHA